MGNPHHFLARKQWCSTVGVDGVKPRSGHELDSSLIRLIGAQLEEHLNLSN